MTQQLRTYAEWLTYLDSQPIFSTHEHHRESDAHQQLTLDLLFTWSYVGWCGAPPEADKEARAQWLDRIRYNTYFIWLEKAICSIYGEDRITPDNWDALSEAISTAHRADKDYHIKLLKEKAGYVGLLEDCYWDSGSDVGYPEFITPVYRLDMWMQGFHPASVTNEGTSPYSLFGELDSFTAYVERMEHEIRSRRPHIAALKCASAYQRTIGFQAADKAAAEAVFGMHPDELGEAERNAFGDYILQQALTVAAELSLPVQVHTGLAKLSGSDPLLLENLIARNPHNQFVLFHGGFPWIYNTAALAHNYPNVSIDINWLPLISTSAAADALRVYIDVLRDSSQIAWGGDTWTSEEAVGAAMAFRHILAQVLTDKTSRDGWRVSDAERFAQKIMYRNAKQLYLKEDQ
ncbi:amidohydrolase family protein [Paenibacillus sp. GCM10023252]|uniref:amidohydrolase family protein n=1 Tax=Paenibacillus sp. GCM10023252 TaxID=3252649 RepID=UPI0036095CE4